jgi:N-acetylglucosamine-6-phosphate deacetylase
MEDMQRPTVFTNGRICRNGQLIEGEDLAISPYTGKIVPSPEGHDGDVVDLKGAILAPGFLELQTNGMRGFHFTHFSDSSSYVKKIDEVAKYLPSTGVTGFYATIPTVHSDEFKKVSPFYFCFSRSSPCERKAHEKRGK